MTRKAFLKYLMHPAVLAGVLALAVAAMYGQSLHNPFVFEDLNFFDKASHPEYLQKYFSVDLRWLAFASFEWSRTVLGHDIVWYRILNLAMHAGSAVLLFFFLRTLFMAAIPSAEPVPARQPLSALWLAFSGALIFALHPAAVYAAAYLIQRSILMALLFTLAMWSAFLRGAICRSHGWAAVSIFAYLLAVLSHEGAIAAPAVAVAILPLVTRFDKPLLKRLWPVLAAYAAIAVFAIWRMKSGHIAGAAYAPRGIDILTQLALRYPGFDPALAYPLSMLTQAMLFFKYLLVWVLPSRAWMAADMFEPFALGFTSWPHLLGAFAFMLYGAAAGWLLLKRGAAGLLGFGLLCPWLMFLPELFSARIQESFVIYRSYLWMPPIFAGLPFLLQRAAARRAALVLMTLVLLMLPLTWNRLATFSSPLQLWDDAARLIVGKDRRPGVERVYHNRGLHLLKAGNPEQAIKDFDHAINLLPPYLQAISDRGAAHLTLQNYPLALADFNRAIALDPQYSRAYLGRALAFEGLGQPNAAMQDYLDLCTQGFALGCQKLQASSGAAGKGSAR